MRTWRLLLDPPGGAAHNMSVDEALLDVCERPTLRLYTWATPSLSLGVRQAEGDWAERCARAGVALVRRATGGGAVLHAGDLTYAVVAPRGLRGVPGSLRGSYRFVQEILLEALQSAGLSAAPSRYRPAAAVAQLCFAGATGYEIDLESRKFVGSAQRRTRRGWLQHGSLRLRDDRALCEVLTGVVLPPPPAAALTLSPFSLAETLAESFARRLPGGLEPGTLDAEERRLAGLRRMRRERDPLVAPPFPK